MTENTPLAKTQRHLRVLMTGSRDWTDEQTARDALSAGLALFDSAPDRSVLIHGAAGGADALLAKLAAQAGMAQESHPAAWQTHGADCPEWDRRGSTCKLAGHRRNALMISTGADLCLAFPTHGYHLAPGEDRARTSRGTWDCAEKAKNAGIPTLVVWGKSLYPFGAPAHQLLAEVAAAKGIQLGGDGSLMILDAWLPF